MIGEKRDSCNLKSPDHPEATITVPVDMDLFEVPLEIGESVRLSKHGRSGRTGREICPSQSGETVHIFKTPSGVSLANARCDACSFTETVGPASRLPSKV